MERKGGCRKTLFTNMAEGALDDSAIAREAQNLIIAGTDTTSVTLTYLIWAVLRDPRAKTSFCEKSNKKCTAKFSVRQTQKSFPIFRR